MPQRDPKVGDYFTYTTDLKTEKWQVISIQGTDIGCCLKEVFVNERVPPETKRRHFSRISRIDFYSISLFRGGIFRLENVSFNDDLDNWV